MKHPIYEEYLNNRTGHLEPKFWLSIIFCWTFLIFGFGLLSIFLFFVTWQWKMIILASLVALPVFIFKIQEYLFFELEEYMEDIFVDNPHNQMIHLELVGDTKVTFSRFFFSQIMFSFRSRDSNEVNSLTRGKFDLKMVFDIHFDNGAKKVWATIPAKRLVNFQLASDNYLIGAKWQTKPKMNWTIEEKEFVAGACIVPQFSNMKPLTNITRKTEIPNLIEYLKYYSELKKVKIHFQYCFLFPANISKKNYNQEFQKYITELTQRYNWIPKTDYLRTEMQTLRVLGELLPETEIDTFNQIFAKLSKPWFQLNWKLAVIHQDSVFSQRIFQDLQKIVLAYFSESFFSVDFEYLTASNQSFFENKKNIPPEREFLHSTWVQPPQFLTKYVAPIYNKVYYPAENNYRNQVFRKAILQQQPQKPLQAKLTLIDIANAESIIGF